MKHFFLIITLAFFLGFALPGQSTEISSEAQLKAAYLYNFAKFIHWPEDAFADKQSPLVIGVLGKNPFQDELAPLAMRTVRNRLIIIQPFKDINEIELCHLLYINPPVVGTLQAVLKALRSTATLTVGDSSSFANLGGIIQFVTRRGRLRFIINLEAARANNIKIDSQLLSLAVEVLGVEK